MGHQEANGEKEKVKTMRTFKIKQIAIPIDSFVQVEMTVKSFRKFVDRFDAKPVFENEQGYFYIHDEQNIVFWSKKEKKRHV